MLVVDGDIIAVEPELCRAATTAVAVFACTIDLCTATLGTFDAIEWDLSVVMKCFPTNESRLFSPRSQLAFCLPPPPFHCPDSREAQHAGGRELQGPSPWHTRRLG